MSRYVDFLSFSHCASFVFCSVHRPRSGPASSVACGCLWRDSGTVPGDLEMVSVLTRASDAAVGLGNRRKPAILNWPFVFTPECADTLFLGSARIAVPRVLSRAVGQQPGPRASNLITSGRNFRPGASARWLLRAPADPLLPRLCADHVHGLQETIGTVQVLSWGLAAGLRVPDHLFCRKERGAPGFL